MAAIAAVSIAAYLPVLATGFTSDDFFILARVKAQNGLAHPFAYFRAGFFDYYRPLAFVTHAIDWEVWGLQAVGYHLRSLLLHAGCAVMVLLIGRRLMRPAMALIAAVLFAVHPASHEAVYWMAARFDLMATFFTLVSLSSLSDDRRIWRAVGLVTFAMGLLSKESAVSLVLMAPAWDIFIGRRSLPTTVRRLLPLVAVVVGYAVLRTLAANVEAVGGERRLMKAVMAAALLAVMLGIAWARDHERPSTNRPERASIGWPLVGAIAVLLSVALWWPATSALVARPLGFVAYAAYYLISPVVFPSPPPEWFAPVVAREALPGLGVALLLLALVAGLGRSIVRHPGVTFLIFFIAGALVPVSSLTGGLRYLYLATAGVALLAGWLLERLPRRGRLPAAALVTVVIVVSLAQLAHAARVWRAGSDMTRNGILLMSDSLAPCGTRDIVLLTAPAGVGGIYANFLYEAFDVLTGCSPKSFTPFLRVERTDVHVDVTRRTYGVIELRVPDYQGNIVASADSSHFTEHIGRGRTLVMDTALGRLETFPDGTTQVFHLSTNDRGRTAETFYYSDGAVRR